MLFLGNSRYALQYLISLNITETIPELFTYNHVLKREFHHVWISPTRRGIANSFINTPKCTYGSFHSLQSFLPIYGLQMHCPIYHVFMFHYSNITRNLRHKDLNVGDRMTKLNVLVTYFGQMRGH